MNFLKSSISLFIGNLTIAFSSLLLGILTARFLEPSGKGELYLVLQIMSVGAIFLSVGISPAYQYFISKKIMSEQKIVSHIFFQICIITLILVGLYLIHEFIFTILDINNISHLFVLISFFGIILNITNLFATSVVLTKKNGIPFHSFLSAIGSVLNLVFLVIFVLTDILDFNTAILSYFIGLLVQIIPKIYIILLKVKIIFLPDWHAINRELFKYAGPSFLTNIAVILVFKLDTFIISEIKGLEALGIYSMAVAFAEITLMLPNSVGTVLFTKIPTSNETEKLELLKKVNKILVFLALGIALLLILASPYFVEILLGEAYKDSIFPLQILAPGLVFMSANYVFTNYYTGSGYPKITAKVYAIGVVINIVSNYYFIDLWGINGAALASTLTYFSIAVIFYFLIKKKLKINFTELFIMNINEFKEFYAQILGLINMKKS